MNNKCNDDGFCHVYIDGVLIEGGVHAREVVTPPLLDYAGNILVMRESKLSIRFYCKESVKVSLEKDYLAIKVVMNDRIISFSKALLVEFARVLDNVGEVCFPCIFSIYSDAVEELNNE